MPLTSVRVVAILAMVLLNAWSAPAQIASQAGPRGQPIPRRSLVEYARILTLSPDQRDALGALFDGYWSSYTRLRDEGDKALQAQHSPDHTAPRPSRRETGEIVFRFVEGVEKLEVAFFDDLRQMLTSEQEPRFESVARERRRETGLRFCFISGERLDLGAIARTLKIPREGPVGASLDDWELQIDRVLVQKDALLRRVMSRAYESDEELTDPRLIEELLRDILEQGFRVRDLNRRFAREISQLLPDDLRPSFDREVQRRSFPRIYVPTGAESLGLLIASRDDLSPDQRAAINEELPRCEREFAEINARIAAIVESMEEKTPGNALAAMESRDNPPEDELSKALEDRRDADRRWAERLGKLLTSDQRQTLQVAQIEPLTYRRAFNLEPEDPREDDDEHTAAPDRPEPR